MDETRTSTLSPRYISRVDYLREQCRGKTVLHLGCSSGRYLADRLQRGTLLHATLCEVAKEVCGLDIDAESLAEMRQLGFDNLIQGNAEKLDELTFEKKFDVAGPDSSPWHQVFLAEDSATLIARRAIYGAPVCFLDARTGEFLGVTEKLQASGNRYLFQLSPDSKTVAIGAGPVVHQSCKVIPVDRPVAGPRDVECHSDVANRGGRNAN